MSRKTLKERPITIPQVKAILEAIGRERLDQFQRRSLDYVSKLSKIDSDTAENLLKQLTDQYELEEEAVQIINCMPSSIQELRVFLTSGRRIMETSKLESILLLLRKNKETE